MLVLYAWSLIFLSSEEVEFIQGYFLAWRKLEKSHLGATKNRTSFPYGMLSHHLEERHSCLPHRMGSG